jgi:hypothetical protein
MPAVTPGTSGSIGTPARGACGAGRTKHSAVKPAGSALFHGRRRDRRGRRCRPLHAKVEPTATADIPVAGQGDEGLLVAEQQTQEMGHLRLPNWPPTVGISRGPGNAPPIDSSHVLRPGGRHTRKCMPRTGGSESRHGNAAVGREDNHRGAPGSRPAEGKEPIRAGRGQYRKPWRCSGSCLKDADRHSASVGPASIPARPWPRLAGSTVRDGNPAIRAPASDRVAALAGKINPPGTE